jgi:hypothetical protein
LYGKNNVIFVAVFVKPAFKLISTILLLVLTLAPVIYPFALQLHQRSIQHRMKERLEDGMLHTITLAKTELRWVKPGKEIVLGENMFDIKTITDQGNGILLITGIYDYEETIVVGAMQKKQHDDNTNGNKQLVQVFQLMQALPDEEPGEGLTPPLLSSSWHCVHEDALPSPFKNILTPPPQA